MNYSEIIRKLREEKGLTQRQLGEMLGMSPQAVSKWETGTTEPDFSVVLKMCELFDVSADYLMGRTDARNAPKMIALHSEGVLNWISDKAFSREESASMKDCYDGLLARYKELINSAASKLKYNQDWQTLCASGASLEERALACCDALKGELKDLVCYIAAFPYHFNAHAQAKSPEKLNLLFEEIYDKLGILNDRETKGDFQLSDGERDLLDLWSALDKDGRRIVLGVATEQKLRRGKAPNGSNEAAG